MALKYRIPGAVALLLAGAMAAQAAPAPDTATCVAALKLHSNRLAEQVKGGDEARRPELLQVLRQGAAFVGQAYLKGMGSEDAAKAKLAQAEAMVGAMPAVQASALRTQCSAHGETLIRQAAGWQRLVIDRFAQSRMDKLLQQPH